MSRKSPKRTRAVSSSAKPAKPPKGPAASELDQYLGHIPGYDPRDQAGDCWFDADAAANAIAFIQEVIKLAKGTRDRAAGTPFLLEPWQKAIVAMLFGWKRPDGSRRYRECFIYVAKKNGKSAFVSALLLFVLIMDCEPGAELYSAAASREQAALIFDHVVGMIRQEPELARRLTVYGAKGGSQQKSVVYAELGSAYKCLSADANTSDGVNPHFVAIDEVHRHADPELAEVLQKSTAARRQPLVLYTTTADYNRPSLCNTMLKRARQVRDNKGDPDRLGYDPGFLPVVYEASKTDDYTDPATWRKANPNLGVTVMEDFLAREAKKAQETPSELNNFLRLHLNIVTDADEAWLRGDRWQKCAGLREGETPEQWRARKLAELRGRRCFLGMDLSSKIDLTAIVQIFRPDADDPRGRWVIIPHFWVPAVTATEKEKADRVPYAAWARAGFVTLTDGDEIDSQTIRKAINRIDGETPIQEIGFDKWNSTELNRQLAEEDGFEGRLWEVRQGSITLSDPMKEFEAMVMSGRLEHGANPAMDWMIGNLCVKRDDNGNIQPSKKKSTNKIDGPVATFTGMARALATGEGKKAWDGTVHVI